MEIWTRTFPGDNHYTIVHAQQWTLKLDCFGISWFGCEVGFFLKVSGKFLPLETCLQWNAEELLHSGGAWSSLLWKLHQLLCCSYFCSCCRTEVLGCLCSSMTSREPTRFFFCCLKALFLAFRAVTPQTELCDQLFFVKKQHWLLGEQQTEWHKTECDMWSTWAGAPAPVCLWSPTGTGVIYHDNV